MDARESEELDGNTEAKTFSAPPVPSMAELAVRTARPGQNDWTFPPEAKGAERRIPTQDELYARYQYRPPERTLPPRETLPVSLADSAVARQFLDTAEALLLSCEQENPGQMEAFYQTHKITLESPFSAEVNIQPSAAPRLAGAPFQHFLQLRVLKEVTTVHWGEKKQRLERVADFFMYVPDRKHPDWRLHHRIVADTYREQGIGSAMLKTMEAIVQAEATRRREPQRLTVDANQVGVILFALNRGYRPQTADDAARLEAFLADDSTRFVLGDDGGYTGDRSPRVGFIFEKTAQLAETIDDWRSDFGEREVTPIDPHAIETKDIRELTGRQFFDPDATEHYVYTINLTKQFEPQL